MALYAENTAENDGTQCECATAALAATNESPPASQERSSDVGVVMRQSDR